MKLTKRRRLIVELAATAIGAFLFLLLLFITHANRVLFFIAFPFLRLGITIGGWINHAFPPQGGGWFQGLAIILLVDAILVWLFVWIVFMFVVKLLERFIIRKGEKE
jgi:hypothetical protein